MQDTEIKILVRGRTTCRACDGKLIDVLDLGLQEVINLGNKEPLKAPLTVTKCEKCGLVQLRHGIDRDYLFRNYYYRSGVSDTMKQHLRGVVEEAKKRVDLLPDDVVVDIGSNDGALLDNYEFGTVHVGFEPAKNIFDTSTWRTSGATNDFFSKTSYFHNVFTKQKKAKIVTALSMFYDLEDPNKFLQDVKAILAPDGVFVLQVNNLTATLNYNAIGDFCHEHLEYYDVKTLDGILLRNDLVINGLDFNMINGGSTIAWVRHARPNDRVSGWIPTLDPASETNMPHKPPTFNEFSSRLREISYKVRSFIALEKSRNNKVTDILGASTRGATFLQFADIGKGLCRFVVERDESKVGKRYLGMPIVGEELVKNNSPDYFLVSPYWFAQEIVERYSDFGAKFIVPLPKPMLIDKNGEVELL